MTNARTDAKTALVLSLHAVVIWLACGLTMAFGRPALGLETTLRIHAVAAPLFAALVSFAYFTRVRTVTPLAAAAFVTAFIIVLDAALVAPVFEKSYAMFSSILGAWLPFLSIFAATYLTGVLGGRASGAYPPRAKQALSGALFDVSAGEGLRSPVPNRLRNALALPACPAGPTHAV